MAEATENRIIKKYPNRRLYDTTESRYITLADVRQLVLDKVDFTVVEKASGDDITRQILLQVIAEQEASGEPALSREFLAQLIRSYGTQVQGVMGSYLEQSMRLFNSQQAQVRERIKGVVGVDPVESAVDIAQRNYQRWRGVQDEIFGILDRVTSKPARSERRPTDDRDES
jgi:polyhydroxyalkanoate synthesis repressor PhaR